MVRQRERWGHWRTYWKMLKDPYLSLMSYRATPLLWCNLSPTQLLMGRRIWTVVPEADGVLIPSWPNLTEFRKVDEWYKKKQQGRYDKRHRARELPEFGDDTEVFITDGRNPTVVPGRVIRSSGTRSYMVETPTGISRRNRCHLHLILAMWPGQQIVEVPSSSEVRLGLF